MAAYKNGIFVWVPKVAGTSITNALSAFNHYRLFTEKNIGSFKNAGLVTFCHLDIHQLCRAGIIKMDFFQNAFKFGFVRNPFRRAVSLYHWFRRNPGYPQIKERGSFKSFCSILRKGVEPVGMVNVNGLSQASPQSDWICGNVDFVGKYEKLAQDFAYVCDALGVGPLRLQKLRKFDGVKKLMGFYYKESECKKTIQDFYECDFKNFGYDIDLI